MQFAELIPLGNSFMVVLALPTALIAAKSKQRVIHPAKLSAPLRVRGTVPAMLYNVKVKND